MSLLGALRRPQARTTPTITHAPTRGTSFTPASAARIAPTAQLAAMGSVGTLFSIVSRVSTAAAGATWRLYRSPRPGQPREEREEVVSHAALDLWNQPNRFFTRQEFVETFSQHLELTGEAWWVIYSKGRIPLELWPVRPDRMSPVTHPTDYLSGYLYQSPDGEKVPLGLDEVIQIRQPNPMDPYRGLGAVQSILADLDSAKYSAEWNRNFFVNSAEPGGIIQVDKRLSDDEFTEMTTRWREQHQGVAQAHRVAVIEQGKWVDRKFSQRDMQFAELRGVSREVIREAFGISKTMLGQAEDVNRATAEAAELVFARWVLVSRLERIKQALNNDLLPLFGATGTGIEFDYDSPVPADAQAEDQTRDSKVNAFVALLGAGVDAEDAAKTAGLPPMRVTADTPDAGPGMSVAEAIQKVYLGVDVVITSDEAREIVNGFGGNLPVPGPPLAGRFAGRGPEPGTDAEPPPVPASVPEPADAVPDARSQLAVRHPVHGHGVLCDAVTPPAPPAVPADAAAALPSDLGPDLGPVQQSWDAALAAALDQWAPHTEAWITSLAGQVRDIVATGAVTDLAGLAVDSGDAAETLTTAMLALADQAAAQAVAEGHAQGVTVPNPAARAGTRPVAVVWAAALGAAAVVVAAGLAAHLAGSAARHALRVWGRASTADDVAGSVDEHLRSLTPAQTTLALGGALTQAQSTGRTETFAAGPRAGLYARESLDPSTCPACAAVDGTWLGWSDDTDRPWDALYPSRGYVACAGGDRCRGMVVAVWVDGTQWQDLTGRDT